MTMLRDQLSALADSVDVPPAPTVFELEHGSVRTRRDWRPWLAAGVAAAMVAVIGALALRGGDDSVPDPAQPPRWSDLDVPWTDDGVLHWGDVEVSADGLIGYAESGEALYVLSDRVVTEVRADGTTTELATGVTGPLVADPDGSVVAWVADSRRITWYDGASGERHDDEGGADPERLPVAVAGSTVYALDSEGGYQFSFDDASSGSASGSSQEAIVDVRAGWTASYTRQDRLDVRSESASVSLRGRLAPSIGPEGAYLVSAGQDARPAATDLTSGETTELEIPADAYASDFGWRWVGPGTLVVPTSTAIDTPGEDDPEVTWLLCSAPRWSCEQMDAPRQPRSEIAMAASAWNYMMVAEAVIAATSDSASAPAMVESVDPAEAETEGKSG